MATHNARRRISRSKRVQEALFSPEAPVAAPEELCGVAVAPRAASAHVAALAAVALAATAVAEEEWQAVLRAAAEAVQPWLAQAAELAQTHKEMTPRFLAAAAAHR